MLWAHDLFRSEENKYLYEIVYAVRLAIICTSLCHKRMHVNDITLYVKLNYFPDMFRLICTIFSGYLATCVFKTQSPFRCTILIYIY